MDNGYVLTGLLKVDETVSSRNDSTFLCNWTPQHLFNVNKGNEVENHHLKYLSQLWYNVVIDMLIIGDAEGIYTVEKTFFNTLKSNLKNSIGNEHLPLIGVPEYNSHGQVKRNNG